MVLPVLQYFQVYGVVNVVIEITKKGNFLELLDKTGLS